MAADLDTLVTIILTLFIGVFGRDFLGRFLINRQQQDAELAASRHERESSVIAALVNLTQTSSAAQIQLTQEALGTLREMTIKMSQSMSDLTAAITRHEDEAADRLGGITRATQEMIERVAALDAGFQARAAEFELRFDTVVAFAASLDHPDAVRLVQELSGNGGHQTARPEQQPGGVGRGRA